MINVNVIRDSENKLCGVKVENHGDPIVCSAVSILLLNTCNSLEMFTDTLFEFECTPDGGDATLVVTSYDSEGKGYLLMESLVLGYKSIEESYKEDIIVFD